MARRLVWLIVTPVLLVGAAYVTGFAWFWRRFARDDCHVAILMFHQISPASRQEQRYSMPDTTFARQITELKAAGASTLSPAELISAMQDSGDGCPFRPREVLLTFDMDGESHQADLALPVLERNGFSAVFFVPTGFIDQGEAVTSGAIRKLASNGMTIGSHSQRHYDMRSEQPDSMVESLRRTRDTLRALTGQAIDVVSAPGGRYNDQVIEGVRTAGFAGFFNSDPCYITPATSPWRICRIEIRGNASPTALEAVTCPWYVAAEASAWWLKRALENVIGARAFRWLHELSERV